MSEIAKSLSVVFLEPFLVPPAKLIFYFEMLTSLDY